MSLLRKLCFIAGLLLLTAGLAGYAAAVEKYLFSSWVHSRLTDAVARGDVYSFNSAIIEVIAHNPANVDAVVRGAVKIAPGFKQQIVEAVVKAFPGFTRRITNTFSAEDGIEVSPPQQSLSGQSGQKLGWAGEIEVGGSRSTGNTEREQFSSAINLTRTYPVWSHEINMKFDFARKNQETSARRLVTNIESRYDSSKRLYAFFFLQYEDDKFSGFDYELTESAGVGYRILHSKRVNWSIDAGPGGRQSVVSSTGKAETKLVGRGKSAFVWNISDTADFNNDTVIVSDEDRTNIENTASLSTKIIGALSAKISFQVRHNSNPPPDTDGTDTLSKISLNYDF